MNIKEYKAKHPHGALKTLAEKINTNPAYLSQLASGERLPSLKMCKKLVEGTNGEMTYKALRPDVYELIGQ